MTQQQGAERTELVIDRVRREATDIVSIVLRDPDGTVLPAWEPGAHVDVTLPSGLSRQYSLCGRIDERDRYEIAVLREEDGRGGSRELHEIAAPGRRLAVSRPRNNFPLDPAPDYLFLAGGIGITPILPMIAAAERAGAAWKLVYCARSRARMAFVDRVLGFPGERVVLFPEDEYGRPDFAALVQDASPSTLLYACGPAGMLAAVSEQYAAHPVAASLRIERFAADGPVDVTGEAFEIELARAGKTLTVPSERSILEVVREVVPGVPYSCEEGYCGECETTVLDGVPDHRDTYLTDEERQTNETMMICVGRCRGARLVLDI